MGIFWERYWIYLGLLLGLIPIIGISKSQPIDLQVLSIFFGALLAIAAIIQSSWDSKTLKRLRLTGHDKYLIEYMTVPAYLSFVLIVLQVLREIVLLPLTTPYYSAIREIYAIIVYALLGVFLLSVLRILQLLAPVMKQDNS